MKSRWIGHWDPGLVRNSRRLLREFFLDGQRAKIARLHSRWQARINRQIRRMFEAAGYRVKHLLRVRVGTLRLGDLPQGHWRLLTKRELESEAAVSAASREPPLAARPPLQRQKNEARRL